MDDARSNLRGRVHQLNQCPRRNVSRSRSRTEFRRGQILSRMAMNPFLAQPRSVVKRSGQKKTGTRSPGIPFEVAPHMEMWTCRAAARAHSAELAPWPDPRPLLHERRAQVRVQKALTPSLHQNECAIAQFFATNLMDDTKGHRSNRLTFVCSDVDAFMKGSVTRNRVNPPAVRA